MATSWITRGNLAGPAGPTGPTGPTGAGGPTGATGATGAAGQDLVQVAPRTQTVTGNANIDCGAPGDLQISVTAGTPTLTPTNGQNGRTSVIECLASGATRTVTLATAVVLTTGITTRALVIPSGKLGVFILRYSTLGTAGWHLASAYLVS